ncbi:MAG: hypothetical protein QNJ31_02135 [Candidatus Caenarcaniphilales bacterium]|nr:hypothetical protein [Candidatus Caenarcaniphilales bacterium]
MVSINKIKSLVILCCFIISSISTASFAWGNGRLSASQGINQNQLMVGGSGSTVTVNGQRDGCYGHSCGYHNFSRRNYFSSLSVPYTNKYHSGLNTDCFSSHYPESYGYYTGFALAFAIVPVIVEEIKPYTAPVKYSHHRYERPKHKPTVCASNSYKAFVNGKWTCHKKLVCKHGEYKTYEHGKLICKKVVANKCDKVMCTQVEPYCSKGKLVILNPGACCPRWKCVPHVRHTKPSFYRTNVAVSVVNNNNQIQVENASQNLNQVQVSSS